MSQFPSFQLWRVAQQTIQTVRRATGDSIHSYVHTTSKAPECSWLARPRIPVPFAGSCTLGPWIAQAKLAFLAGGVDCRSYLQPIYSPQFSPSYFRMRQDWVGRSLALAHFSYMDQSTSEPRDASTTSDSDLFLSKAKPVGPRWSSMVQEFPGSGDEGFHCTSPRVRPVVPVCGSPVALRDLLCWEIWGTLDISANPPFFLLTRSLCIQSGLTFSS